MNSECHMHMILDGVYYRDAIQAHRNGPVEQLIAQRLAAYQSAGITYLRDGGDAWGVSLRAREMAPAYGITYTSPAFPIHRRGRYGAFIGRGYGTREEYLALLDEAEALQADFIKVMVAGLVDYSVCGRVSCPPLEGGEMAFLVAQAHRRGFAVMAHVNGDGAVADALRAGVDSVEHGNFMEEETLRRLADSGAVWVPTLATTANIIHSGRYDAAVLQEITDRQMESVARAAALGAPRLLPAAPSAPLSPGADALPPGPGPLPAPGALRLRVRAHPLGAGGLLPGRPAGDLQRLPLRGQPGQRRRDPRVLGRFHPPVHPPAGGSHRTCRGPGPHGPHGSRKRWTTT